MFERLSEIWRTAKMLRDLKMDEWGFGTESMAVTVVGVVVVIVIATALIATVANNTWLAQQNTSFKTFTNATGILPLLVLFFVIGVAILPIALIFVALRDG